MWPVWVYFKIYTSKAIKLKIYKIHKKERPFYVPFFYQKINRNGAVAKVYGSSENKIWVTSTKSSGSWSVCEETPTLEKVYVLGKPPINRMGKPF